MCIRDSPWTYTFSNGALAQVYAARHEADLAELHFKRAIAASDSFHVMIPLYGALLALSLIHI